MRLGPWQTRIADNLRSGAVISNPLRDLVGRAKSYYCRYSDSFQGVLAALNSEGYYVVKCPGPRGGEWGAEFKAYKILVDSVARSE